MVMGCSQEECLQLPNGGWTDLLICWLVTTLTTIPYTFEDNFFKYNKTNNADDSTNHQTTTKAASCIRRLNTSS